MAGGMIGSGQAFRRQGQAALSQAANMEQRREQTNERLEQADTESAMSLAGMGAGIGASIAGPWGAVIGGGAGLLASALD